MTRVAAHDDSRSVQPHLTRYLLHTSGGRHPTAATALEPTQLPRAVAFAKAVAPDGAPPTCYCGNIAVLRKRRFWCARDEDNGGCLFEMWTRPGVGLAAGAAGAAGAVNPLSNLEQPLCDCDRPAVYLGGRWWCAHNRTLGGIARTVNKTA